MVNPTISYIVPVYNSEKFLRQCLDSIFAQTIPNWECIVVDDGSNDGSGSICDEYAKTDERFKVIHKDNEGVSIARNIALDHSKGKFIAFVDSDDIISSNFLEILEQNIKDADLLMFSNQNFYNDGGKTTLQRKYEHLIGKESVEKYILTLKKNTQQWEFYGYIWNKCYLRSIIEENHIRFTPGLSYREDNVFNEMYYRNTKSLIVLDDVLYFYRVSSTGLTNAKVSKNDWYMISVLLDRYTDDISYEPLKIYDKERIFRFLQNALIFPMFKDKNLLEELRSYARTNDFMTFTKREKLVFRGNAFKNYLFYVLLYVCPYLGRNLIKFITNARL